MILDNHVWKLHSGNCSEKLSWGNIIKDETPPKDERYVELCIPKVKVIGRDAQSYNGVHFPVCSTAYAWLQHFRSDAENPTEKLDSRNFLLHIKPKAQICTTNRKYRSAHKAESKDLHIRPKVQIWTSERKFRSAHQTESTDLNIRSKAKICTSDRKGRSVHQAESADLHIRPKCRSADNAESADLQI